MKTKSIFVLAQLVMALASAKVPAQTPLGPAFTYQGQLKQSGQPYNGAAVMSFGLWDAQGFGEPPFGGTQLGTTITLNGVPVNNGLFTVSLNANSEFGPNAFNGEARWLQITVNGEGLVPRQRVSGAPYAQTALAVPGIDGHSLDAADGTPTDVVFVNNDGNVGIGTTTPTEKLDVLGNLAMLGDVYGSGQFILASGGPSLAGAGMILNDATTTDPGWLIFQHGNYAGAGPNSKMLFRYGGGGQFVNQMVITSTGNVGIGTLNPAAKLSVAGTIESTSAGFKFPDGSVQMTATANAWSLSGDNIYNNNSGNVGIGTTTPAAPLHVFKPSGSTQLIIDTTPGGAAVLDLRVNNYSVWQLGKDSGSDDLALGKPFVGEYLRVKADSGNVGIGTTTPSNKLSVTGNADFAGNVGIGTTAPQAKLDVNGTTRTNVLQITGGSDIAEPFNINQSRDHQGANEAITPGMVVSIDPQRVGELRLSTSAYDSTVAGVISGAGGVKPGMTLTQESSVADGKHPVALSGRVWCWCDAGAAGPIQAGDLLTTSPTPGHAMKVIDRQRAAGATLGKAMSSLDSGRELVLVLVNLQ